MSSQTPLAVGGRPEEAAFIHLESLVLCNNDHGYDSKKHGLCPRCGARDRLLIRQLLSPEVLAPRIAAALARLGMSAPVLIPATDHYRLDPPVVGRSEPLPPFKVENFPPCPRCGRVILAGGKHFKRIDGKNVACR